jgi:hypothetical protein
VYGWDIDKGTLTVFPIHTPSTQATAQEDSKKYDTGEDVF